MNIQNESLFRHSLANGINLFLGAGFSVAASSKDKLLPVGEGLKTELIDHFKRPKPSTLSLPQLCQIIASTQRDALVEFFRSRFHVDTFAPEYKNLERASVKDVLNNSVSRVLRD